jgi:CheY-like chemotaxis protein
LVWLQPYRHPTVVEGDALLQCSIAHLLHRDGWRVLEASTDQEALAHLNAAQRVDVMFTDIQLPGPLDWLGHRRCPKLVPPDMPVISVPATLKNRRRATEGSSRNPMLWLRLRRPVRRSCELYASMSRWLREPGPRHKAEALGGALVRSCTVFILGRLRTPFRAAACPRELSPAPERQAFRPSPLHLDGRHGIVLSAIIGSQRPPHAERSV